MKRQRAVGTAAFAWFVLHVFTAVRTFFENWYNTYTGWSWMFLGIWLLGLLALDAWLYASGKAEPLRSLKWFWGFSAGMYGVMTLCALLDWTMPDLAALVFVICSFVTPVHQLTAFAWLFRGLAGPGAGTFAGWLFCLAHFVYLTWLHRQARQRGETVHGPVDPGAGTVE